MPSSHSLFKRLRLWSVLCLVLLCISPLSFAQIPTDKIIAKVERQTGGRVIAVKANSQQKNMYDVRVIMPNGRVKNLVVNGATNGKSYQNNYLSNNRQKKLIQRPAKYKGERQKN